MLTKRTFDVGLHTILIEKTGNFVNAQELWNIESIQSQTSSLLAHLTKKNPADAVSASIVQENAMLENDLMMKLSISAFDRAGTCNRLLRSIRTLYNDNKDTYHLRKKDSYHWGSVDKLAFIDSLIQVCELVRKIFLSEPRLMFVASPVYVMGDLHGNFGDLLTFENCFWSLSPHLCPGNLLFLGDYVDRGIFSLEVSTYLLCYKALNPGKMILIRGNHEIREIQKMFSFAT